MRAIVVGGRTIELGEWKHDSLYTSVQRRTIKVASGRKAKTAAKAALLLMEPTATNIKVLHIASADGVTSVTLQFTVTERCVG